MIYRQLTFNLVVAFSMVFLGILVAKTDSAGLGLIAIGGGLSLLTMFSYRVEKKQTHHRVSAVNSSGFNNAGFNNAGFNSTACQHESSGETSCR